MDEHRFDALARALGAGRSRRRTLGLLAGAAAAVGLAEADEAAAERGKGKGKGHGKASRHDGKGEGGDANPAKKKKCKGGKSRCGKKCFDLQNDVAHCGNCDSFCLSGQVCQGGACTCGGSACSGCCDGATCKPGNDPVSCGSNGGTCAVCATGGSCNGGTCTCPSGQADCGGTCTSTTTVQNCGGCGHVCGASQGCCGGTCTSLTTVQNCGACGNACGASQGCCGGTCTSLATVQNCGACGATCPGLGKPNANVTCQNGGTCTFSCQGDAYDVDNNPGNGCEQVLTGAANHTSGTAKFASPATQDCFDSSSGGFSGTIASDARAHANPNVPGFDAATGSAPQFWKVTATGGSICQNGLDVLITMTGATSNCYGLTVTTDKPATFAAPVVNGTARINPGDTGIYSDDSTILFKVEKTCGTSVREVADYTVSYHL